MHGPVVLPTDRPPACPLPRLQGRTTEEMKKVLSAADAPQVAKLLLHDCATFDRETGTGGCNGSVVLP